MDKDLNLLVDKLKAAAGTNLESVVLYGSAARGEFRPGHSDLNVLCILKAVGAAELEKLRVPAAWWEQKGHPAPLVFTLAELRTSADVFAIELMDIQASRRVLFGHDVLAEIEVPTRFHSLQVERELRTSLVRLRQGYLAARRNDAALLALMDGSLGTFKTLFRHALIALGEPPAKPGASPAERLGELFRFDATPFHALREFRHGAKSRGDLDVEATFRAYLGAITCVTEEVDRRLASSR